MDGTSGGTMTPPRDENATCDDFAPVIPLRRRQHNLERPVAGEPPAPDFAVADSDPAIPGLDELPSVWQQPEATELLIRPTTAAEDRVVGEREATAVTARGSGSPHGLRRRFIQIAAVSAVLATTAAVVVAAAGGGSHPRPTHATATLPTSELGDTVTHTPPVKPATHDRARRSATKMTARSHAVTRHSSKRRVRHTTLAARESVASSIGPASTLALSTQTREQTTAFQHGQAPVHNRATAGSGPASSCVPGELGC